MKSSLRNAPKCKIWLLCWYAFDDFNNKEHLFLSFFQPEHVCGHDHHGRLMKGVFYQHSAYAFCLIPEMLRNLEPVLSNNSLPTDTVVCGLRRLSQGGLCRTGWLSCLTSLLACRHLSYSAAAYCFSAVSDFGLSEAVVLAQAKSCLFLSNHILLSYPTRCSLFYYLLLRSHGGFLANNYSALRGQTFIERLT